MEVPSKLNPMLCYDVEFTKQIGDQLIADCIFCGKNNHFYCNFRTGAWDCKRCGLSGGISRFLKEVHKAALERTTEEGLQILCNWKPGLKLCSLQKWEVALRDKTFLLPVYDITGNVTDIRRHKKGSKKIATLGARTGIMGIKQLNGSKEVVYVCENEFDCIALDWLISRTSNSGIVVSCPGVNTLKKDWYSYFLGKDVIFCFDNDTAGDDGTRKHSISLKNYTSSIQFVNWPDTFKPGYDIRDFVAEFGNQPNKCYKDFQKLVKPYHRTTPIAERKGHVKKIVSKPKLKEVIEGFDKFMELNGNLVEAIKISLATSVAIKIPGSDPLWMFIVGPPSCGKTTILNAFRSSKCCNFQSTLRTKTLVSGWQGIKGVDPSLLGKLNGMTLILKDFTEFISRPEKDRGETFSLLRGAYDGEAEYQFGNGAIRKYKTRFGILAGVTKEIYAHSEASMGERFLKFSMLSKNINIENQQEAALEQAIFGVQQRDEIQEIVAAYLDGEWVINDQLIRSLIPSWFYKKLKPLARLAGILRTQVHRHEKGVFYKTPVYTPTPELGNRLAIQLQRLALSLALIEQKKIDEDIWNICRKVVLRSI